MKKNNFIILLFLWCTSCTCTFTFVGLVTIKDYNIKKSSHVVEQALIDVQYKYPDLRIDKESREKFKKYDISVEREGALTKEDSVYLEKYSEDYYRNTFGRKEFELSSLDEKYVFFIQVLTPRKSGCKLVIESFSEKFDKSYVNSENLNRVKIKEGLQVFDREIWPKIKECIEEVNRK
jgi:hypothetical protein